MIRLAWAYWALCQLVAVLVLFPLGLVLVGAACTLRAWTRYPATLSIKPLQGPLRIKVDTWNWAWLRPIWGNPEDGVSGLDALGPSWVGPYNPAATRALAFAWSGLRNWACGWNYLTWRWSGTAPNYQTPYVVPRWIPRIGGTTRTPRLGWQQLPASDGWVGPYRCRMVCSL